MAVVLSLLLFFLPTAAYLLWLRRHPGEDVPLRVVGPALAGLALGLACLIWYGLSGRAERGTAYVPARLDAEGRIVRDRAGDAPPGAQAPPR